MHNVRNIQDREERWLSSLSRLVAESADLTCGEYTAQQLPHSPALQHCTYQGPCTLQIVYQGPCLHYEKEVFITYSYVQGRGQVHL